MVPGSFRKTGVGFIGIACCLVLVFWAGACAGRRASEDASDGATAGSSGDAPVGGSDGTSSGATPEPPGQPTRGPGGGDYAHAKVNSARFGTGGDEYWLFQPDDPQPDEAPVVVFLHGFGGVEPRSYGAWIQHIVRKGHTVIYPRYQESVLSPLAQMPDNALRAIQSAWERLNGDGQVTPRSDRIAWVGHSFGGMLAANLSIGYGDSGLPPPAVLMLVQPGGTMTFEVAALDALPADALVLLILGDADDLITQDDVQPFVAALAKLPAGQAEMITINSDDRGAQPLVADHLSPLSVDPVFPPDDVEASATKSRRLWGRKRQARFQLGQILQQTNAPPDALDFYGYWKLLDGLLDASFRGRNREFALGNTAEQRFMGFHSDGSSVTPLVVVPLGT